MQYALFLLLMVWASPLLAKLDVTLHGELVQGAMIIGQAPPGSKVQLNDDTLRQTADGYFVFGLDRDTESGDVLKVTGPQGDTWHKTLQVAEREYDIQHVEGIDQAILRPDRPPEVWQRIRKESAKVGQARAEHQELEAFRQNFKWPIIGRITGVFGSQRVYNGRPGRPHYGVDVAAPVGAEVYAPADGLVTLAHDDMFFSGGTLIIDHGYGISSSFLHLSEILAKPGDIISQGDLIARVGAGGMASGPHLDWRMNWYQRRIDPQLLVPDMSTLLNNSDEQAKYDR